MAGKNRLWLADCAAAVPLVVVIGGVSVAGFSSTFIGFLIALWLLRRFGLLAWALSPIVDFALGGTPQILDSFWGDRVIFAYSIPIALSTWALWVVLTDHRGRSIETTEV